MRPCHLLEMCRCAERPRLLEALASFCSALANNSLSSECMQLLTTARLVAVAKPNEGVRPIAVGETLRRLAAKCVHEATLGAVFGYLLPLQVGVKMPNTAVARKVKARHQEAHIDEAIMQIDIRNAFNFVDRNVLLREVQECVPALNPLAMHTLATHCRSLSLATILSLKARAASSRVMFVNPKCSPLRFIKPYLSFVT